MDDQLFVTKRLSMRLFKDRHRRRQNIRNNHSKSHNRIRAIRSLVPTEPLKEFTTSCGHFRSRNRLPVSLVALHLDCADEKFHLHVSEVFMPISLGFTFLQVFFKLRCVQMFVSCSRTEQKSIFY